MTFDSKEVNAGNLGEYIEYAKTLEHSDADRKLSDDLPLEVLFQTYERVPDNVKYEMAHLTMTKYMETQSPELLEQVLDLARTHPKAFEQIFYISGRASYGSTHCKLYQDVLETLKKTDEKTGKIARTFEDNIYIAHALLDTDGYYPDDLLVGRGDPITTLSKDKDRVMVDIFAARAKIRREGNNIIESPATYRAGQLIESLNKKGVLLNYDPKQLSGSGVTWDDIRAHVVVRGSNNWEKENDWQKLDEKFVLADKEGKLLKGLVVKADYFKQYHSTRVMQAKEINRDDLMFFDKARKLVLQYAKKYISPYDQDKKGERKSVSRQMEELSEKLWNMNDPNASNDSVLSDAYLHAIYEDINAGNADKLSPTAQKALASADKDAYWLKKMFEKQPEVAQKYAMEHRGHFSRAVADVADYVINAEKTAENEVRVQSDGVVLSKHLTMAEKEKYLEVEKAYVEKMMETKGKAKKEDLQKLQEKAEEYKRLGDENQKALNTRNLLRDLQVAYDRIWEETKEGKSKEPQGKEEYLSKENVEKILMNYPQENVRLPRSDQKPPILFGAKEKERIEALNRRIDEFNQVLDKSRENAQNSNLGDFRGRILDGKSFEIAKQKQVEAGEAYHAYGSMYGWNFDTEIAKIGRELNDMNDSKNRNSSRKQALDARKDHLESVVKSRAVSKGKSPLEAVREDMSKEEKAEVRKNNKKVVDPLVAKVAEKKDSRR